MCSWGGIAVGELRHTADRPSRSALLGLLAAALGIERTAEAEQAALGAAVHFGYKVLSTGSPLRDYHTVQAPRSERKVTRRTRRQELAAPVVNTLLSTREYRLDSVSVVAVTLAADGRWTLDELQNALREPRFALYLGRKSCPLALPLAPEVVEAADLQSALNTPQKPMAELARHPHASLRKRPRTTQPPEAPPAWPASTDTARLRLGAPRLYWEHGMVPAAQTEAGGALYPSVEYLRTTSRFHAGAGSLLPVANGAFKARRKSQARRNTDALLFTRSVGSGCT